MNDLIINLVAGLVSGVLAPIVVTRLGGGSPPTGQSVSVHGDHNDVTQLIDNSQTSIEVVYDRLPSSGAREHREGGGSSASQSTDPTGEFVSWLAGAIALVLAYFFIWPAVVWAFAGAAIGIILLTAWTAAATRRTPGPRIAASVLMLISAGVLLVAAWWTLNGGPGSDVSFASLEAKVAEQHPEFSTGMEGRWEVVTSHPGDILEALGMRGFLYVLTQAGALAFGALLFWARVHEIAGWIALHNLQRNPKNPRLIERAIHFKELGAPAVIATVIASIAICLVTGGWAHSWLARAQEEQFDAITDTR